MKRFFKNLGPGIITAALVFGPGSITVTSKLGAAHGYSQLWVIVLSVILMISFARIAVQIGLRLDNSLMDEIRRKYGKVVAIILGFGIFGIAASFQAGNSIGAGIAFSELFHMSSTIWILIISALAILLVLYKSFYAILEKVMIGMVVLMLSAFLLTVIISRPSLSGLAAGLIPSIPKGSELLTVALVASSFSIIAALYQAYLVREKNWGINEEGIAVRESRNGIIVLGLLSSMVLICGATVLHSQGLEVNTASDLGLALEPLFGSWASRVFMVGFFAASFSSLVGNATIGGSMLADAFSLGKSLESWNVRLLIIGMIIAGSSVAIIFGRLPLQLIIFAQALTIIVAPVAAIMLLLLYKSVLGKKMSGWNMVVPSIGLLVLISLAIYNVNKIFF